MRLHGFRNIAKIFHETLIFIAPTTLFIFLQQVSLETDLHETVSMLLADSLRLLLEHGLLDGGKPVSYTIGCFPAWRNWGKGHIFNSSDECAAWKVVKHYYNLKVGMCLWGREREGQKEREREFINFFLSYRTVKTTHQSLSSCCVPRLLFLLDQTPP